MPRSAILLRAALSSPRAPGGAVAPETSLAEAVRRMREARYSCLPVVTPEGALLDQILHARIGGSLPLLATNVAHMQKTKNIEPMSNRHYHHVFFFCQVGTIVDQIIAGAGSKASAMHPDHHRSRAVVSTGCEHVELQTVFAFFLKTIHRKYHRCRFTNARLLERAGANLEMITHAGPWRWRLWRHETICAGG